jgi:hypothetical protein
MDDLLQKQLLRQLKLLNFWITFFGVLFLVSMAILGILLFKVFTYVHHTTDQITNLQQKTEQSLNVKSQICGSSSVSKYLGSSYCK